jgi:hypothetical protein
MAITTYYQGALTGNLITINIAGSPIGLIQSVQAQEDFGLQPVSGIGNVAPVEHAPGTSRINLSCETIYISPGAALQATTPGVPGAFNGAPGRPPRIDALGTASTLELIQIIPESVVSILRGAVFDIEIRRINDKALVRRYIDCSYAGGSISFQKHQIIMQNATFMALDYTNKD